MGLLRALNPLCTNVTAPRHRTARAAERMQRDLAAALAEASAAAAAPAAPAAPVTVHPIVPLAVEPERWSQAHADAIMAAHRAGDRAGVELAIAAARESIGGQR